MLESMQLSSAQYILVLIYEFRNGFVFLILQIYIYISSVYSPFSDRVGLPLHNIPSSGVLFKSIGAEFLRPDALPGVYYMRGMQYQIVINITFCRELK